MGENTPFAKQSRQKERGNDNGHNMVNNVIQLSVRVVQFVTLGIGV